MKDLTGMLLGKWTVVSFAYKKNAHYYWLCECSCGTVKHVESSSLTGKRKRGCLLCGNKKHGLNKHPLYSVWHSMKTRCYVKKNRAYKWYGGRGIAICNEWLNDVRCFYDWALANGFVHGLQLDRINNEGNYEPNNCRFVSSKVNIRNSRHIKLTIDDVKSIKFLIYKGVEPKYIAKLYHITKEHVYNIKHNKSWKDIGIYANN